MNYQAITEKVIEIAQETGDFISAEASRFSVHQIEKKGLNDLVSYVDKQAEAHIIAHLKDILPQAGFIAEENTLGKTSESTLNWIIDPLDGTTNFIHGIPTYAVSIALYDGQKPLVAVVYEPNRKEMFYTYEGAKSFLNGNIIQVSNTLKIEDGLLATGFPYYDFEHQTAYMELLKEMMQSCHGIRRIGAAAVDLAYVACGRFAGFFEYNLKPWDVAAGAFIVQQAGGKCTDFKDNIDFFSPNQMLATNTHIHSEMIQKIAKYF